MARVSRICVCVVLMAFGLAVSGCSSALRLTGIGGFDDEAAAAVPAANPVSQKMQVGDHINVTVYNEASLSGNYSIDSGGFVTDPARRKAPRGGPHPDRARRPPGEEIPRRVFRQSQGDGRADLEPALPAPQFTPPGRSPRPSTRARRSEKAAGVGRALAVEHAGLVEQEMRGVVLEATSRPRRAPASETISGWRGLTSRIGFAAVVMRPAPASSRSS